MIKLVKRMAVLFICATMVASSCTSVAAQGWIGRVDTVESYYNPADFVEANAMFVQKGKVARNQRSAATLDVPHYYQSGQVWSSDIMQTEGLTIGAAGCCLTSFTMIHKYLGGIWNPRGVNNKMGDYACLFHYRQAASIFNYEIVGSYHDEPSVTDDYAIDFIIGAIESGLPVLVGMKNDSNSNKTHFVTAYGYSGSTIYIHDPASNIDYTELSQYLANYSVNRLYVYSD